MDYMSSRERDISVDIESGGNTSEEDGNKDPVLSVGQAKKLLTKVWCGSSSSDGLFRGEDGVNSCDNIHNLAEVSGQNVDLLTENKSVGEEILSLLEKKSLKEKRKKTGSKKPPRPPRGPFLDAADQKLVKEITELAMLKRARIERMKAQKKMKTAKTASSNSNLCAMIITILFCLVIMFQGICSRGSSRMMSFHGSPEAAVATRGGGLISVQYYKNVTPIDTDGPGSGPSNLVEQALGSEEKGRRVAG